MRVMTFAVPASFSRDWYGRDYCSSPCRHRLAAVGTAAFIVRRRAGIV